MQLYHVFLLLEEAESNNYRVWRSYYGISLILNMMIFCFILSIKDVLYGTPHLVQGSVTQFGVSDPIGQKVVNKGV